MGRSAKKVSLVKVVKAAEAQIKSVCSDLEVVLLSEQSERKGETDVSDDLRLVSAAIHGIVAVRQCLMVALDIKLGICLDGRNYRGTRDVLARLGVMIQALPDAQL